MRIPMLAAAALVLAIAGCTPDADHHEHADMSMHGAGDHAKMVEQKHENMWATVKDAVAVIYPTKGNSVSGTIHFTDVVAYGAEGVHIWGTVTGLEPNSTHAIHIHEFGDQTSADGMSAGGHFNPEKHQHGAPGSGEHHAGDLGNIKADGAGNATIDLTVKDISVAGMKDPVIGRGVVIHAKADDFGQPVGNAGGRIGVGVIGVAKPLQ